MAHPHLVAPLQAAIAAELRHVRVAIERLAEMLVGDEDFVNRYLEQFQAFDMLVQCTDESAALLDRLAVGRDPHDAVDSVRLGTVQQRLRVALAEAA